MLRCVNHPVRVLKYKMRAVVAYGLYAEESDEAMQEVVTTLAEAKQKAATAAGQATQARGTTRSCSVRCCYSASNTKLGGGRMGKFYWVPIFSARTTAAT